MTREWTQYRCSFGMYLANKETWSLYNTHYNKSLSESNADISILLIPFPPFTIKTAHFFSLKFNIYSFIHSANTYWSHTMDKIFCWILWENSRCIRPRVLTIVAYSIAERLNPLISEGEIILSLHIRSDCWPWGSYRSELWLTCM